MNCRFSSCGYPCDKDGKCYRLCTSADEGQLVRGVNLLVDKGYFVHTGISTSVAFEPWGGIHRCFSQSVICEQKLKAMHEKGRE